MGFASSASSDIAKIARLFVKLYITLPIFSAIDRSWQPGFQHDLSVYSPSTRELTNDSTRDGNRECRPSL